MRSKGVFFFLLFAFLSTPLFSQDEDTSTGKSSKTSVYKTRFGKRIFNPEEFFKQPTIIIEAGLTDPSISSNTNSIPPFNNWNSISLKIGTSKILTQNCDDFDYYCPKFDQTLLFLENFSSKWIIKNNNKFNTNLWRFGLQSGEGSGYEIGSRNLLLFYTTGSMTWSKLDYKELPANVDTHQINPYKSAFRFGTAYSSNISFLFSKSVGLDISYVRSVIFPGHKFWYWLGSFGIEFVSVELLETFTKKIFERGSNFAPIVDFILKSGLYFGIYELRRDKMYWPFNSIAPLFNQGFRIGLNFLF